MQFKTKLALTLTLTLFSGAQLTAWADSMVDKAIVESYNFRHQHNAKMALSYLQAVEKKATNNAAFHAERAAVYVALDQYDEAMKDCNIAIKLDPKLSDAYDRRAFCYTVSDQLDKAIGDYTTAIKLNPKSPMPYHNRAIAYRKLGKLKEANSDMKHYLTLRPAREEQTISTDLSNHALNIEKRNDAKAAIDYLKFHVNDKSPSNLPLHLATLYAKVGDLTNALTNATLAVNKSDQEKDISMGLSARVLRASIYAKQRDFAAAIKDCSTVILQSSKAEPVAALKTAARGQHAAALTLRAECYQQTHKLTEAMNDINQVIKQSPDLLTPFETRGNIYLASGKQYKEAVADFSKVLKSNPNSEKSRMGRAVAYSALKQYKAAIQDYSAVINKSPKDANDAYTSRARIYKILHEDKKAAADLVKANQSLPD
ncbi:tetratricopeptide repeat protein [bacterium]|nr:tetratricopeptide repeat protein [bacterium]